MGGLSRRGAFAQDLRKSGSAVGIFQKTPHHQITEILAQSGIDFIVLDAEHAPFDPSQMDACLLAAIAGDLPAMVRVARNAPDAILAALDLGATGIFVPHVASERDAVAASGAAKYAGGGRGFSPSTRAGGYGTRGLRPYMVAADLETALVLQIEDASALGELDAIAAVPGVAGLFVGRADLAASMDVDWNDPVLDDATRAVAAACAQAGIACGAYLADPSKASAFRDWGVSFLVAGADQGALRSSVGAIAAQFIIHKEDRS